MIHQFCQKKKKTKYNVDITSFQRSEIPITVNVFTFFFFFCNWCIQFSHTDVRDQQQPRSAAISPHSCICWSTAILQRRIAEYFNMHGPLCRSEDFSSLSLSPVSQVHWIELFITTTASLPTRMALKRPSPTPITFWERLDLVPAGLSIFGAVLYSALTGLFRGKNGARTYRLHLFRNVIHKMIMRLSLRQVL